MEKSKVYFTDFRTVIGVSLTEKLRKLIKLAGMDSIDMGGKFVAIKMHFGELGNHLYVNFTVLSYFSFNIAYFVSSPC